MAPARTRLIAFSHVTNGVEILSSSFAAAAYLTQNPLPAGKKVYVIGQEGICEELALHNIPFVGEAACQHE